MFYKLKPQKSLKPVNCAKCGANNHSHSKFCTSCGIILQAPIHTLNTQALTVRRFSTYFDKLINAKFFKL